MNTTLGFLEFYRDEPFERKSIFKRLICKELIVKCHGVFVLSYLLITIIGSDFFASTNAKSVLIDAEGSSVSSIESTLATISWNPKEENFIATLSFTLDINFTSSRPIHDVVLTPSDELRDLVYIGKPHFDSIEANELQFPQIGFFIGPKTTGGWHNGTITVSADGFILEDKLEMNIQVPKLSKVVQPAFNGSSIYYITVPSYSPFFNNTVNFFTWLVLANGSQWLHPYMTAYDVFRNDSAEARISLLTDKAVYSVGDEITITGELLDYRVPEIDTGEKIGLAIYRVHPFISVYESFVTIERNGTFSMRLPVSDALSQEGVYDVNFLENDAYFRVGTDSTAGLANMTETKDMSHAVLTPLPPGLASEISPPLLQPWAGQEWAVVTNFENNDSSHDWAAIFVVEVRDPRGATILLDFQNGTVNAGSAIDIGVSWIPLQAGSYELRTFAISGFDHLRVLSSVRNSTVVITASAGSIPIQVNHRDYVISYKFFDTGRIVGLGVDATAVKIDLSVENVLKDGAIELRIPFQLLDEFERATDGKFVREDEFVVFVDGLPADSKWDETNKELIMYLQLDAASTYTIEILGSFEI
jgi:hypothetical protein